MDEKNMTPKHRDVVVKLRERIEQYRRRHSDCQTKQERSFAIIENQERQEAIILQKRVLEGRNPKLVNKTKQDISKIEHASNGIELKSTNAILQQQIILKRKHDQGINNMNCDGENGKIGENLPKYPRSDDIHSAGLSASHGHQMSIHSSQGDQQNNPGSQSDSINAENLANASLVGSNGHFVGDTSRSSPISGASGAHTSEAFQNANRVASPNSLPPTEFKQESHSVAVTCDGGRNMRNSNAPRDSLPNGVGLSNSTRSTTDSSKTVDSVAGHELQQQLNDFERVLMKISNSDMYKNTGINPEISSQHHQLSRQTASQIDPVTRDVINPSQQPNSQNPSSAQQNPYPNPPTQGPPGPTALHLQQLARQAQSQRAQASAGYIDGQEQDNSQYKSQQIPFMDAFRFTGSGSQQQLQSQSNMQQTQRYRGPMVTNGDQYGNMYSKDQNHNVIMSTGFPSTVSQYQRMMTQAQQQQAMYSRMTQQGMPQRLTHPTIPEHQQTAYPQYQTHQSQYNNAMPNLPAYSTNGYQNIRSTQNFQRQLSMPAQGYHDQYAQPNMNQYPLGDQQVPNQPPQTELSSSSYHSYNRRNSFPAYHRSISQPVANFGPGGPHPGNSLPNAPTVHPGYQAQINQMRNTMPGTNPTNPMMETRNNPPAGYTNYNNRTSFASQSGLQGLMQLPQRNVPAISHSGPMQARTDQQNMGYTSSAQNMSQEMKYSTRGDMPKNTRGPSFNDPLALTDPTSTSSTDSHYNPFSPLGSLEKAPSFASLLDQPTGALNNLETTYTGSIPNLDLLGEIIGQ